MRTPTRSPTPCASRSRPCASGSANPGSSPPWPASGTASTLNQTPDVREETVDRARGLSVRVKLTLSYAGFLMVAGALLLAAVWVFLLRYIPDQALIVPGSTGSTHLGVFPIRSNLLHVFAPRAAAVLAFLLVFGLLGGWILAGRMLAPLTRITDATRTAASGSLSHRIRLPARMYEFRERTTAVHAILPRLEGHVAEHRRFAANASHELRTPL